MRLTLFFGSLQIVRKILRSLTENFRPKVTVITESKDVNFIPVNELVRSLQSYELTMFWLSRIWSCEIKMSYILEIKG